MRTPIASYGRCGFGNGAARWIFFLLASAAAPALAADPATVGPWGDPGRLSISGATTFSADSIRRALAGNVEVQLAASVDKPLADYLTTVRDVVEKSYQRLGFPDVHANCELGGGAVRLHIYEGSRCKCGDIRIEGAVKIPVDRLIKRLREPTPKEGAMLGSLAKINGQIVPQWIDKQGEPTGLDDPFWGPGVWPMFNARGAERSNSAIGFCLGDVGFPSAMFASRIDVDRSSHQATLVVRLLDEGSAAVIKEFDITGNQRNSQQAILDFLHAREGMEFTAETIRRWQGMLWESGRFIRSNLSTSSIYGLNSGFRLRIELVELAEAPPLGNPLSPSEAAMFRCREWMMSAADRDEDFVATFGPSPDGSILTIVESPHGAAASLAGPTPRSDGAVGMKHAMIAADVFEWYSFTQKLKFVTGVTSQSHLKGDIRLAMTDSPKIENTYFFALWSEPDAEDGSPHSPFKLSITVEPASLFFMLHRADAKSSVENGVLTVSLDEGSRMRIEMATGRLIELRAAKKEDAHPMQLTFQRGALASLRRQIDAGAAGIHQSLDPRRPVSSIAQMLADEDLLSSSCGMRVDPRSVAIVKKLIAIDVFRPLDDWVATLFSDAPTDANFTADWDSAGSGIASWVLDGANQFFGRGEWPWLVGRETAFGVAGKWDEVNRGLTAIYDDSNSGPICMLTVAGIGRSLSMPPCKMFAARGRDRLSLDKFQGDYRALLDQQSLCGQTLLRLAGGLRSLAPEEVELLAKNLPPDLHACLLDSCTRLRKIPASQLAEALPPVLDHCWEAALRQRIDDALAAICNWDPDAKPAPLNRAANEKLGPVLAQK